MHGSQANHHRIETREALRRFTLCLPFYCNAGMLERTYQAMEQLPEEVRENIGMIVVDDGTPEPYAPAFGRSIGLPLSVYRIDVDIRWNQDAARNIAVHHCRTRWALMTDIDHLVPLATWQYLIRTKLNRDYVYRFSRMTIEKDDGHFGKKCVVTPYKPHPNSWLMTSDMYDRIGGYDESFAGHYGTDAEFRDRVVKTALGIQMLDSVLLRVPRTTIPDASTTTYTRKGDPVDSGAIQRIKAQRFPGWSPKRLSFPYREIGHWK